MSTKSKLQYFESKGNIYIYKGHCIITYLWLYLS